MHTYTRRLLTLGGVRASTLKGPAAPLPTSFCSPSFFPPYIVNAPQRSERAAPIPGDFTHTDSERFNDVKPSRNVGEIEAAALVAEPPAPDAAAKKQKLPFLQWQNENCKKKKRNERSKVDTKERKRKKIPLSHQAKKIDETLNEKY